MNTLNIQGAAKKTPLRKLEYLQNGETFLYEIFSDYQGENLLQMGQVLCDITQVCGNDATFGFQCVISLFSTERALLSV